MQQPYDYHVTMMSVIQLLYSGIGLMRFMSNDTDHIMNPTTKLHRRNGLATSASSNCIRFNITAITLVHSSSELDLCIWIFPATENILSYIALRRLHTHTCSLIPRPTPLPVLWFALTILLLHWSRRAVTKEKARYCSCSSREWHQVDMR